MADEDWDFLANLAENELDALFPTSQWQTQPPPPPQFPPPQQQQTQPPPQDWDFLQNLAENEFDSLFPIDNTQWQTQPPPPPQQTQPPPVEIQPPPPPPPPYVPVFRHDYVELGYRIPGPAGILQSAHRRRHEMQNNPEKRSRTTEEIIREVMEEEAYDDSFEQLPWLLAIQWAYPEGGDSNIGAIPGCLKRGKLDMIVGVISELNMNAVGDLSILMKDTTGSIHATIHRKILADVKGICVGCVIVVKNASVFRGVFSSDPLGVNITKKNFVKIYYKDGREWTPTFIYPPNVFASGDGASTSRTG